MTVTRDTRLLDVFELPEPIFAECSARRVRTVGDLLGRLGPTADARAAAEDLFHGWTMGGRPDVCAAAAVVVADLAERLTPAGAAA